MRHGMLPASLARITALLALAALAGCGTLDKSGSPDAIAYRSVTAFLKANGQAPHTHELRLGPARVLVTPALQGRVLTSTFTAGGRSIGWVNPDAIEAGDTNDLFNNYGGEDRFWLAPEGGPFALFFAPGQAQVDANWRTPAALNTGGYTVNEADDSAIWMTAPDIEVSNAAGASFRLHVERSIHVITRKQLWHFLKAPIPEEVEYVGFQSENRMTNLGDDITGDKGTVAVWSLGQFPANDHTVAIVPFNKRAKGDIVSTDYFEPIPADRLVVDESAGVVLFRVDSHRRGKIGLAPPRATEFAASMDFANNVLTIVMYDEVPGKPKYLATQWINPNEHAWEGDVINVYNHHGADGLMFYELETTSPAALLKHGESLAHHHRTMHFRGSVETLSEISERVLGVSLEHVRRQMHLNGPQ